MDKKIKRLMELNGVASLMKSNDGCDNLKDVVRDLVQNQADLEEAIIELAKMIGE